MCDELPWVARCGVSTTENLLRRKRVNSENVSRRQTTIPSGVPTPIPMARRGPQYDLLQLLLRGGDQRLDEASEERLEQLYQEVAPQVRHRPRAFRPDPATLSPFHDLNAPSRG